MNQQPQDFRYRPRRTNDSRATLQNLREIQIGTIQDAILFVDVLVDKLPDVQRILKSTGYNRVLNDNKSVVDARTLTSHNTPGDAPVSKSEPTRVPTTKADEAGVIQIQPVKTEGERLAELRAAQEKTKGVNLDKIMQRAGTDTQRQTPDTSHVAAAEVVEPKEVHADAGKVVATAGSKGGNLFFRLDENGKKKMISPKSLTEEERQAAIDAIDSKE